MELSVCGTESFYIYVLLAWLYFFNFNDHFYEKQITDGKRVALSVCTFNKDD